MADNFEKTVNALMNGINEHLQTKTVIGDPVKVGDTVIFPMADVSFGIAASSSAQDKKDSGVGAKMTPSAVLIVQNGTSRIINIKDKDSINKIIDMVPDIINKISSRKNAAETSSEETKE